jgi:hypothetical protein
MTDNKHLPAYPCDSKDNTEQFMATYGAAYKEYLPPSGLSKRELIAAMCLQGLLSNPVWKDSTTDLEKAAVLWADCLLTHLSNTEQ